MILDRGRTNEERSLILIEGSKYKGYGYIDSSHQITSLDDCKDVIRNSPYYPDSDELVKSWMKTANHYRIFKLVSSTSER